MMLLRQRLMAAKDKRVDKVCIWTPDKDLAQCVRAERVVQIDARAKVIRDEKGVKNKFGVGPLLIPDYLALVGDSADGYPGISGIGKHTAVRLLNEFGPLEKFPESVLGKNRDKALVFKNLATLRTDGIDLRNVDDLRWKGLTDSFGTIAKKMGDMKLFERAAKLASAVDQTSAIKQSKRKAS